MAHQTVMREQMRRLDRGQSTLQVIRSAQLLSQYVKKVVAHERELAEIQNGQRSRARRMSAEHTLLAEKQEEQAIKAVFDEFDTDGNGVLDCEEFIAGMTKIKDVEVETEEDVKEV